MSPRKLEDIHCDAKEIIHVSDARKSYQGDQ